MKKIISAILCLMMSFTLMAPSFAATPDEIDPQYMPAEEIWVLVDQKDLYDYNADRSEWKKCGFKQANATGERLVASAVESESMAIVFSGTLSVAKGLIETSLNLSFTKPVSQYNTAMVSAPLKAGQCVQAYHVPRYTLYQIIQQKVRIDQTGKSTPIGGEVVCYVSKPITPTVEFEYYYD